MAVFWERRTRGGSSACERHFLMAEMYSGWSDLLDVVRRCERGEPLPESDRQESLQLATAVGLATLPGAVGCSITLQQPAGGFNIVALTLPTPIIGCDRGNHVIGRFLPGAGDPPRKGHHSRGHRIGGKGRVPGAAVGGLPHDRRERRAKLRSKRSPDLDHPHIHLVREGPPRRVVGLLGRPAR